MKDIIKELMPAIIAIVSMVGGFFLGLLGDRVKRKNDFREQRLNDTYQKRIVIYEDILNMLSSMTSKEKLPMDISIRDLSHKITEYTHTLNTFVFRLTLLGDENVVKLVHSFVFKMKEEHEDTPEGMSEAGYAASLRSVFCNTVKNTLIDFTETVRKEIGANELNKRIRKITIIDAKKK